MRLVIIVFVCLFLLVGFATIAQPEYKPLKVGDKVPDVVLTGMRNYKSDKGKMSDFKGKAIILDFWNKFCTSCIAAFPKMEKLQSEFGRKLQILLVTNNSDEMLKGLFQQSSILKSTKLPFVINDRVLYQLFPHIGEPFHVWIDSEGIVKAFATGQSEATSENVQSFLSGSELKFARFPTQLDFNGEDPLITEGGGRQWAHLQYYSMIMKGVVGVNATVLGKVNDPTTGEKIKNSKKLHNANVLILFGIAYSKGLKYPMPKKTIVEGRHGEDFFIPKDKTTYDDWRDTMSYSYESVWPSHLNDDYGKKIMQQTLQNYFGVTGAIERRSMDCYIMYRTTSEDKLGSNKGGLEIFERSGDGFFIRNCLFQGLFRFILTTGLMGTKNEPVVIDETGIDGFKTVDMDLKNSLKNLPGLQKELASYGIGIRIERREIDCLVLKDL